MSALADLRAGQRGPAGAAAEVRVTNLTKRFGEITAVDGLSFSLEPGTFFALLGPSGCGKTPLLRMLAGFEQPDAGEISLGTRPLAGVPPYRRPLNTVFQHWQFGAALATAFVALMALVIALYTWGIRRLTGPQGEASLL